MSEWISVKDRYPKSGQHVKIRSLCEQGEYCFEGQATYSLIDVDETTEAIHWTNLKEYSCTLRPTHWQPLPEPPNE